MTAQAAPEADAVGIGPLSPLAALFDALELSPNDWVGLGTQTPRRPATWTRVRVGDLLAMALPQDRSVWIGANPLVGDGPGRGTAADVARVVSLHADLDVKPEGLPNWEAAWQVVAVLSDLLGSEPVAVVSSGHGLQPRWAIEPDETTDERLPLALRRFGRLVARVAADHGGSVDPAFDTARMLRAPGSVNWKAEPVQATLVLPGGSPLSVGAILGVLDAYGVPSDPAQPAPGDDPGWAWGPGGCGYAQAMITGWASDHRTERIHQWAFGQSIRLAAARRLGCVSEAEHAAALGGLSARVDQLRAERDGPRGRQPTEIPDQQPYAVAKVAAKTEDECWAELGGTAHRDSHQTPPDDDAAAAGFWDARPWLRNLHDVAKAKMVSPVALLAVMLARIVAEIPEWVVIPGIAGPRGSLNLFVALVGEPSAGKSAANGVGGELWPMISRLTNGWEAAYGRPGSGEGLMRLFGEMEKEKDPETGRSSWKFNRHSGRVFMSAEEVGIVESLSSRSGATLAPILREAWGGVSIGFSYADPAKRGVLDAHSYRLALVVGAQPGRVGFIINEDDAGTPQRYLWIEAEDRGMDARAPQADPQTLITLPVRFWQPRDGLVEFGIPEWLWWEVRERRAAQGRKEPGAPGQHEDLNRLTVAVVFAAAAGRMEVNRQDWDLAGVVIRHSLACYARLLAAERLIEDRQDDERGKRDGKRRIASAEQQLEHQALKAARAVHRHALSPPRGKRPHGAMCAKTCLRGMVSSPGGQDREAYSNLAIGLAVERGWVHEQVELSKEAVPQPRVYYTPGTLP